jgi:hypothetical protein
MTCALCDPYVDVEPVALHDCDVRWRMEGCSGYHADVAGAPAAVARWATRCPHREQRSGQPAEVKPRRLGTAAFRLSHTPRGEGRP